jgi:hypothetical protein
MTKRKLKWIGAWACALILSVSLAWALSPASWLPQPKYCAPHWCCAIGREYAMLYYVTIRPPAGKTAQEFPEPAALARVRGNLQYSSPSEFDAVLDPQRFNRLLPTSRERIVYSGDSGFLLASKCVYVPLRSLALLILVVVGSTTAVLWYLDWRRPRPGYCERCGYDLRANVSGRCPECGCATKSLGKEDCTVGP